MKSLEELGQIDRLNRIGEFAQLARCFALGKGIRANAVPYARSQCVRDILTKDAVAPGGAFGSGSWGEQLAETRLVLGAFSDSLRHASAWAAAVAANLVIKIPLASNIGLVAAGSADASVVAPTAAAPVHRLDVSGSSVERQKSVGLLAVTDEFLRQSPSEAEALISRELRNAVGAGIDTAVITTLTTGVTPHTSTGSPISDARTLLEDVDLTPMSRPFWISGVGASIRLATTHSDGIRHAPDVSPVSGGSFLELPMFVSPGVDTNTLVLVDGAKVAGNLEQVELGLSRQALVALDDAPTGGVSGSPATLTGLQTTNLVSAFQENLAVLRCLQWFGATKLRSNAVASVFLGGSPS